MESPENAQLLQRQAMNRSSFYMLLFLFSLLFLNFSEDEATRRGRPTIDDLLESYELEKETLNNVTFGINNTHPLSDVISKKVTELHNHKYNSHYYHNITGVFRGTWQSENVTVPDNDASNRTLEEESRGSFNTNDGGSFTFNIKSIGTTDESVNYLEGYIRLKDAEKSDYGALLQAEGVHFLSNGSIYLLGALDGRSIEFEELLHMLPTNESMVRSRAALTEQIDKRVENLKSLALWGDQIVDDREPPMSVNFGCVFEIFAQLEPVPSDIKLLQLLEYEKELENPQGISTIRPPPLQMSSVMYSPNCGLALTSDNGIGAKIERYYSKAISYATMASVLAIVQIFALIHQMEYTPTPSSVSNVSYWTVAMQSMMDGYLCLLHLTTGVVIETVFMPFATAAFFSFVLVSVFGMRYLLLIWRIQRPENNRSASNNNNSNNSNNNNDSNNNDSNNNDGSDTNQEEQETILPIANRPQTTSQPVSDPRRDISALYYRMYALLLFGLFLFYQTATRSAFVQSVIIGTLGFCFYSYWIPQIVRNIIRGCRRPLSRRYVIGMSITRLAIPLYFYGCPENLIAHEPSPWIWALVAFVAIQVLVLFLQDILGPRFFVPEKYLPQTYNYHPILPAEDEENLQENSGKPRHPRDCAICMLPVDTSASGPPGLHVLGRAQYMLTPCQHLFHTDCLERWMRIKLECPVCRSYLPAC